MIILVSACLAGERCRYDGGAGTDAEIAALVQCGQAIPVCPERLGGLSVPRVCAEITGGDGADVWAGRARVLTRDGEDVSEPFLRGAQAALDVAQSHGIRRAVLKARSPSCGAGTIYDGTFGGTLRRGDGVTAALLRARGIEVQTR